MGKELEPKIQVPDIKIEADKDNESGVKKVLGEWPRRVPIVQINDYVLPPNELLDFSVYTGNESGSSSVPTFRMKVNDPNYVIQEALKNKQIDIVNISFGLKDWLIKFTGIISTMNVRSGSKVIYLYGVWYNEKLYKSEQQIFTNKSLKEILLQICDSTDIGLFTYDNEEITKQIDKVINPNIQNVTFIEQLIRMYSTNIYCFDVWGYLHLGSIEEIIKQPIDKYTFNQSSAEKNQEEHDIIFRINKREGYPKNEEEQKKLDFKINITNYSISNDYSVSKIDLASKYVLESETSAGTDKFEKECISDQTVGIADEVESENTFHGFINIPEAPDTIGQKFPFRKERINKQLVGNKLELELDFPVYELTIYSIVGVEMYHALSDESRSKTIIRKDKEHSGKYLVLSIEYKYITTRDGEDNKVIQIIKLFKPESIQEPDNTPDEIIEENQNVDGRVNGTGNDLDQYRNYVDPYTPDEEPEPQQNQSSNNNRRSTANMHISARGIAHIKRWEGFRPKAYKHSDKKWTIGYGHTAGVKPGQTITQAAANQLLIRDLIQFENGVKATVRQATQGEFDALVSLAYNMGVGGFNKTKIAITHNAASPQRTAKRIRYIATTSNGKTLQGLVNRRSEEANLYLS